MNEWMNVRNSIMLNAKTCLKNIFWGFFNKLKSIIFVLLGINYFKMYRI